MEIDKKYWNNSYASSTIKTITEYYKKRGFRNLVLRTPVGENSIEKFSRIGEKNKYKKIKEPKNCFGNFEFLF
jgi:hypothetical protein